MINEYLNKGYDFIQEGLWRFHYFQLTRKEREWEAQGETVYK